MLAEALQNRLVEVVWSHLKRNLANLAKSTLDQLLGMIKNRLARMQHRPNLITGYLVKTRLDLPPPRPQPRKGFSG